jgi:hypothetical protein
MLQVNVVADYTFWRGYTLAPALVIYTFCQEGSAGGRRINLEVAGKTLDKRWEQCYTTAVWWSTFGVSPPEVIVEQLPGRDVALPRGKKPIAGWQLRLEL